MIKDLHIKAILKHLVSTILGVQRVSLRRHKEHKKEKTDKSDCLKVKNFPTIKTT